jgi:PAS domain S-box-containing protein
MENTTFVVSRAISEVKQPRPETARRTSDEIAANILIVDDHPANLIALDAILSPLGHRLIRAASGHEALEALAREEMAVVLLDVRMPGLDGFKTAELIRDKQRRWPAPVIFLTAADTDPAQILQGYARGAVDFLMKPFEPEILRSKVSVFVDLYVKEQLIKRQSAMLRQQEIEALEHRSESRFRRLMDAVPLCVVVTDSSGRPVYWNRSALSYAGVPPERQDSRLALLDAIHPGERGALVDEWDASMKEKRSFELKFRIRRGADGSHRWHLGRGIPRIDESDRVIEWILTATDIDLESQALAQAEAANRIKDEFLATVSHELRNPLNAIIGWVHLLRGGELDPAKQQRALETVERNVQLQVALIDEILDLSRITRNKVHLTLRSIDLGSTVESALTAMRPAAEAKKVALEWERPPSPVAVSGDPERMQQIISNLVSNAVKFTPAGGRVTITLERQGRRAKLTVSDTGIGINPGFLPFVFDPFKQADSSTTRQHSGLGLGLAITKKLVELHGGGVTAQSGGAGQGASFSVSLPLLPGTPGATDSGPRAAESRPRALTGISILIVDDDADSREILAEILGGFGALVATAESSQEALASVARSAPDVLISDIAMPGEDGFSLVRALSRHVAERNQRVLPIALTGLSGAQHRQQALDAGFAMCMNKPLDPIQLVDYIASQAQQRE